MEKYERRIVGIAALIQLVNFIDFMMVMPLGPDISRKLPISTADIGIIGGAYTLAAGFSGIVCAKFLDRFDRKKVALFTVAGLSLTTFIATFCWDLTSMVTARVLAGFFGGPAAAIAFSMVCDAVPPERRGKAMAIVLGSFSVSSVAAIPFGLELAARGSWKTPFFAITSIGTLVVLATAKFLPSMTKHRSQKTMVLSLRYLLSNKDYVLAFIMMMTAMISSYAIIPSLSAYFQHNLGYPRSSIGFLFLVGGFFSVIFIQMGGRAADKIGAIPTNILGTVLYLFVLFDGFMRSPISPAMFIFVMFMGTTWIRHIAATTEVSKLPKPAERAAFMSLLASMQHIGNGIGALLASAILVSAPQGKLLHMEYVGLMAIGFALIQPFILLKLRQGKRTTKKVVTV